MSVIQERWRAHVEQRRELKFAALRRRSPVGSDKPVPLNLQNLTYEEAMDAIRSRLMNAD